MENIIKDENKSKYNSILQMIKHKPLIVEHIFPLIEKEPYKFLDLIEKDNSLKESINSLFFGMKNKNLLSQELNNNIQLILLFKYFQEQFRLFKDKNEYTLNKNVFEKDISDNNLDPSFIMTKSKYILNQIKNHKKFNITLDDSVLSSLTDIAFYEKEKYETIRLTLLPLNKNKYKDSLYIIQNLKDKNKNKNCLNKEIDLLYCIIDDNEYYLSNIPIINKEIIINNVYFIYIKGSKNININNAIEKYLSFLNKKNIKKITLNSSFFHINNTLGTIPVLQMTNDSLINNKKYSFPNTISINFEEDSHNYLNKSIIYLGLYNLFRNQKLDRFIELDYKNYSKNISNDKLEQIKGDILVIKFNDDKSLDDKNFSKIIKKYLESNIPYKIYYITKEANENKNINDIIKCPLEGDFLIYSEIPAKKPPIIHGYKYLVTDSKDHLILFERYLNEASTSILEHQLFLLNKYKNICFQIYCDSINYISIFFNFNKNNYIIFIVANSDYGENENIIRCKHKEELLDIDYIIKYCKENLNLKINKIFKKYSPFGWNDILKDNKKGKSQASSSKKNGFGKLNQKQLLDYELEDVENSFSDEDNENYDDDDYNSDNEN